MDAVGERAALRHGSVRATLLWTGVAVAAVVGALVVGVVVGPVHIPLDAIVRSAVAKLPLIDAGTPLPTTEDAIVWQLRVPRVVLAALVGAMLAVAGASYQGVFRNPLADPYLLGVAAGAGLGATIAIAYGGPGATGSWLLPLAAFGGAVVSVLMTYAIGRSLGGERTSATLILAGVTVAAFLTSVQTFVQQQNTDMLNEVYAWLLGGLATAGWRDVTIILPYVAVSTVVLLAYRRTMDVFAVGDDEARSLGLDVGRTRAVIVAAATLGTAAAVAVSGLIAFVGIIIPHLVRLAVSSSYRVIVPLSVALGASFLVLADVVARTALAPAELPIGVVTAFVGGPFFAVVLRTSRSA